MGETVRVVAVQLAVRLGAIEENLRHIEDIVGAAVREHTPDMVFLPEVSTTPNISHVAMRTAHEPVDGPALALYRRLAREHGCVIGAGALTIRGEDTRNTYFVCEPDGAAHLHDKDQPSMWEHHYYAPGEDPGIAQTARGAIGVANGFEWIRVRTAARLRGQVRLLAGGMCFPSYPTWAATRPYFWNRDHEVMLDLARRAPARMARALGVPAVHPSHVGAITMQTPLAGKLGWPTILLGETQITDADGRILEHLAYEDGEGYVCADVDWAEPAPRDPLPANRFWMSPIPISTQAVWHVCNTAGRADYLARKARGGHAWQSEPYHGQDLPTMQGEHVAEGVRSSRVERDSGSCSLGLVVRPEERP